MPDIAIIREGQDPIIISGLYDGFTFDEKALEESLDKAKEVIEHMAQTMGLSVSQIREALKSCVNNQNWAGFSTGMACKASMDFAKAYECPKIQEDDFKALGEDVMCQPYPSSSRGASATVQQIGSRRARLALISVFGRRGAAEWLQRQERPKKYLDCRKNQRRGRRKK